ncbi:MAG: cellulase family glycosylhydrolase [Candidatus Omnitrophica bacterium]|nr:cellulase family glycosylhydrolase [Candidatus Omnitrophota bacterium]
MAETRQNTCESPFGVLEFLNWNHDWNNFHYPDTDTRLQTIDLMQEAGVSIVRMDFLWQDIEPSEGLVDYSKYDAIVDLLYRHNIQILGLLDYSADWASACNRWNCPPRDNALFVKYATAVVSRYKDKIKYWELWNEPDSHTYWEPQDGLQAYAGLLKDVYTALKREDPACVVLNGGLSAGLAGVNKLYDAGAQGYFDVMNVHIFESPADPIAVKRAQAFVELTHKVMARNGDGGKKIWITEVGAPGVRRTSRAANWWMGKNPSEKEQARWVRQVYTELLKDENVEKIFWAFFRDTNRHWKTGVDHFGLIRNDFSAKPSFGAYKEASSHWKR